MLIPLLTALALAAAAVVAAVIAARWRPEGEYDLVVIGGGAAGLTASGIAASLGAKTLLIERDRLGGDCTWTGCVPSKALLKVASVVEQARAAAVYGLEPAELGVDLARVLDRIHELQREIYDEADSPEAMGRHGVEVLRGDARFVDPTTLEIATEQGVPRRVRFRRAVVCTGSRPRVPAIDGLDRVPYLTSESVFEQKQLPRRLLVLGAGPVGAELSQAFARLGASVTVIERGAAILPKDDPELTAIVQKQLEREGVGLWLSTTVERAEHHEGVVRLHVSRGGAQATLEGDALLVATGRAPRVDGLGLDAAGVRYSARGVEVDRRCRTSARHIYACGDVVGQLQLTHVAEHMAKVAALNAVLGLPVSQERAVIPRVTFTSPEVAQVGARRSDLDAQGRRYELYRFPYAKIDRAVVERRGEGWVHLYAAPRTGKILGATLVGESAGELVAEVGLAMKHGIALRQLADTIHAYPTVALGNRRAADQWYVQRTSPTLLRPLMWLRGLRGRRPSRPDPSAVV